MKISISQPTLFPWIGYFNMIKNADIFVFLDNVKFQKQSWHMRNRIKSGSKIDESEVWIRIPTNISKTNTNIEDVLIQNNEDWKFKHLRTFESNYGGKYKEVEFLQELYQKEWDNIADFNIEFITKCCQYLEITTKLVRASELQVQGKKSHLLLNICKKLGATEFLPNKGSLSYLERDEEIFKNEKIIISYPDYKHPYYNQKGVGFLEKLSILDLLFSEYKNSKKFI
jgi:hypothetical protein